MGEASAVQASFLGGEWSQAAQGRFDLPTYKTAMNVCLNGLSIEPGLWQRRPGFQFAAHTRGGVTGRLIAWAFKQTQPYNIEFTDGFMRFYKGTSLATTNDAQVVVSISSANPAKVATTTAHGWSSTNTVLFGNLQGATPLLLNRQFVMTKTSSTEFTLTDALTGATIDGSTLGSLASGATIRRILEIVTPYNGGTWSRIRSVQASNQSVLFNGTTPQVLTATAAPTSIADATFTFNAAVFKDGPYFDPVTNGTLITADAKTGIANLTTSFSAWVSTTAYSIGDFATYSSVDYVSLTAANVNLQPDTHGSNWAVVVPGVTANSFAFQGSDVGRMLRLFSEPAAWLVGTTYSAGQAVKYSGAYYIAVASTTGNQPDISPTKWGVSPAAALWTWGRITGLRSLISRSLSGSASIGDLTAGAGLSALFDGVTNKNSTACAERFVSNTDHSSSYGGKDYHSASDQVITSATVFPAADTGFVLGSGTDGSNNGYSFAFSVTLNLRAKASAPSLPADGTLLGTVAFNTSAGVAYTTPFTIVSNDQTTAWKYVWIEIVYVVNNFRAGTHNDTTRMAFAQVQFFTTASGSANGVAFQIVGSDLLYTTAITTWRFGLYSDTTGYPTGGTYDGGRLWMIGFVDNRVDASQPNDIFNFAPTLSSGQVTDACAIDYTFDGPDQNALLWVRPDLQGIIANTQAGEWLIQSTSPDGGISPLSVKARRVTKVGGAFIEPVRTEHTLVFVQKFKRKLIEFFADVYSGKMSAPNLSAYAKHLMKRNLAELQYQQEPTPIIWSRCGDGTLIGCTYKREALTTSQGPTFAGWHQHTLGSGRTIESIAVGPNADGTLENLAIVSNDAATGIRHVEVMTNILDETNTYTDSWFLDDAITPAATATSSLLTMTGLWHLNGKTVTIFAGGVDCGDVAVSAGTATVALPAGPLGVVTSTYLATFGSTFPCVVGFTYTSSGQTLRPIAQADTGARNGPALGKTRRIHKYALLLLNTFGISIGSRLTKLDPILFKDAAGTLLPPTTPFSGVYKNTIQDTYSLDGMVGWSITRPYPATVIAVEAMLQTQDE